MKTLAEANVAASYARHLDRKFLREIGVNNLHEAFDLPLMAPHEAFDLLLMTPPEAFDLAPMSLAHLAHQSAEPRGVRHGHREAKAQGHCHQ
jgi:hypothetical protein